jgi:hypothetical protein
MKRQQHQSSLLKQAPHTLLGLAALAVLGLISLAVSWSASGSSSYATRAKPQQPAAVLQGFLRTCPLPGYCYQRADSAIVELQPSEPLITAYRIALKQYLATHAFQASADAGLS